MVTLMKTQVSIFRFGNSRYKVHQIQHRQMATGGAFHVSSNANPGEEETNLFSFWNWHSIRVNRSFERLPQ